MTNELKKDYFIFFVGLMTVFKLRILGTFYGSEILAYLSYFFIDWRAFKNNKHVMTLVKMSFVWLIGVVASDLYNSTPTTDAMKGSFNVIFLIMLVPFAYWMIYEKPIRLLYFTFGSAIAQVISFHSGVGLEVARGSILDMNIWRVYFYYNMAIVVASWLYYKGKHIYAFILILAYGLWSLSCASRNIFLSVSLSVAVLFYIDRIKSLTSIEKMLKFRSKSTHLVLSLVVAFGIVSYTYETLASSGILGDRVYEKYMMQKYAKGGLASGRSDSMVSIYLAAKNPIFGYGSYAKNKNNNADIAAKEADVEFDSRDNDDLLPGHSHIFGAWVYAGIGGLIYWLYILIFLVKRFRKGIIILDQRLLGFVMFIFMMNMWNIFFSPFQNRMSVISLVILFMVYDKMYNDNKFIES